MLTARSCFSKLSNDLELVVLFPPLATCLSHDPCLLSLKHMAWSITWNMYCCSTTPWNKYAPGPSAYIPEFQKEKRIIQIETGADKNIPCPIAWEYTMLQNSARSTFKISEGKFLIDRRFCSSLVAKFPRVSDNKTYNWKVMSPKHMAETSFDDNTTNGLTSASLTRYSG